MQYPPKKPKKTLGTKVNQELEKIVYQVMTNEGLEQTVNKAIQKALNSLIRKYLLLAVFGLLALSIVQAILFSLAFKWVSRYTF